MTSIRRFYSNAYTVCCHHTLPQRLLPTAQDAANLSVRHVFLLLHCMVQHPMFAECHGSKVHQMRGPMRQKFRNGLLGVVTLPTKVPIPLAQPLLSQSFSIQSRRIAFTNVN